MPARYVENDHPMKSTIEIADPLARDAKALARKQGVTLREWVEPGLKLALAERKDPRLFKLRDASVAGQGLHPTAEALSWEPLRALIYAGHGG